MSVSELNFVSFGGLFVMLFLCWLLSEHRWRVSLRVVLGALLLQFALAGLIYYTPVGTSVFAPLGVLIEQMIGCVRQGCEVVFGDLVAGRSMASLSEAPQAPDETATTLDSAPPKFIALAFLALPVILVFSALMASLYYLRVMPLLVQSLGWVLYRTLGTSGAESLTAAANVFVGQNTAPLVARPYLERMTKSELMTIMVAGFSTIAVNVLAVYVAIGKGAGITAQDLLAASIISAPGALLAAKILQPETERPESTGHLKVDLGTKDVNLLHAITRGAEEGLKIALSVGAMLITFIALVAMLNGLASWTGDLLAESLGWEAARGWTLEKGAGVLFWPLAWCMGFPTEDCFAVSQLLGQRFVLNEFLAYQTYASGVWQQLSERSQTLVVFAMCGFANLGSIGVQIGGLGMIMPTRKAELASIGLRAMLGGTLASFIGACVVGTILPESLDQPEPSKKLNSSETLNSPQETHHESYVWSRSPMGFARFGSRADSQRYRGAERITAIPPSRRGEASQRPQCGVHPQRRPPLRLFGLSAPGAQVSGNASPGQNGRPRSSPPQCLCEHIVVLTEPGVDPHRPVHAPPSSGG